MEIFRLLFALARVVLGAAWAVLGACARAAGAEALPPAVVVDDSLSLPEAYSLRIRDRGRVT